MAKPLFVLFQGSGTNLKSWNEYTKSKFLDKLKSLGDVYMYQDKVYNIWHYDTSDPEHLDFDADIDIDLSYVRPKTHIMMVYNDIRTKYDLTKYNLIPVGWSAGCLFALYFAQQYKAWCIHVILLDSALWTPKNMVLRLQTINKSGVNRFPQTNMKFKKRLHAWQFDHTNIENMYAINDICHGIRSTFFSKHLKLKLPIPVLSFVNIQSNDKERSRDWNNKTRLSEIKVLEKHNPLNYKAIVLKNKTHYIFNTVAASKKIIDNITRVLKHTQLTKRQ